MPHAGNGPNAGDITSLVDFAPVLQCTVLSASHRLALAMSICDHLACEHNSHHFFPGPWPGVQHTGWIPSCRATRPSRQCHRRTEPIDVPERSNHQPQKTMKMAKDRRCPSILVANLHSVGDNWHRIVPGTSRPVVLLCGFGQTP